MVRHRANIKTKSVKKASERGPDCDLEQHGLREPKKGVPSRTIPHHFGSQMGAKLEPNGVKMAFEIASKFEVEFGMPF